MGLIECSQHHRSHNKLLANSISLPEHFNYLSQPKVTTNRTNLLHQTTLETSKSFHRIEPHFRIAKCTPSWRCQAVVEENRWQTNFPLINCPGFGLPSNGTDHHRPIALHYSQFSPKDINFPLTPGSLQALFSYIFISIPLIIPEPRKPCTAHTLFLLQQQQQQ